MPNKVIYSCAYCRHYIFSEPKPPEVRSGLHFECQLGVDNSTFDADIFKAEKKSIIEKCPLYDLTQGFMISGRRPSMWFIGGDPPDSSLTWVIKGRFAFPKSLLAPCISKDDRMNIRCLDSGTPHESLALHICSFWEIEQWAAAWGAELRRRCWIKAPLIDKTVVDPNRRSFDLCGRPSQMDIIFGGDPDSCYTWYIRGGFQFDVNNIDTPQENISIQIDSFPQVEEWVNYWKQELKKKG